MKTFPLFLIFLWYIACCGTKPIQGQNTFEINIGSEEQEYVFNFVLDDENNYVGIVTKTYPGSTMRLSYLYKIGETGDTVSKLFSKPDTILTLRDIIIASKSPIEYLVTGTGYQKDSSSVFWYSYFARVDANLNIIWEKIYQLHDVHDYSSIPFYPNLLKLTEGGFLHACYLEPRHQMFLFKISDEGDSLAYRLYEGDSSGMVQDLTYNYDSTAYWLHTHFAHYDPSGPESQCITIDFNLQQTEVVYYPRWLSDHLAAKLLPDRNLVVGSRYRGVSWDPAAYIHYVMAYKLDTGFNVLDSCYITDPVPTTRTGSRALDFYNPDNIYMCGEDDAALSTYPTSYNHIAIARMDQNLNLISEKYVGGDANYASASVVASPDGGVLLTCTRYDYLTQYNERDVYILKLDSSDFTVGNVEHKTPNILNAIVYPNPGSEVINIRTSIKNTHFELYDQQGQLVLDEQIKNLITPINVQHLPPGVYVWKISDNKFVYETGKWIKQIQ